jgi:hypothetical protein
MKAGKEITAQNIALGETGTNDLIEMPEKKRQNMSTFAQHEEFESESTIWGRDRLTPFWGLSLGTTGGDAPNSGRIGIPHSECQASKVPVLQHGSHPL